MLTLLSNFIEKGCKLPGNERGFSAIKEVVFVRDHNSEVFRIGEYFDQFLERFSLEDGHSIEWGRGDSRLSDRLVLGRIEMHLAS